MKREEILEIYKEQCTKSDKTRDRQWRTNISLWTLLVLAIWFFDTKTIELCWFIAIALLFIFTHFLFVYLTQLALKAYRLMSDAALNALDKSENNFIDFTPRYFKKVSFKKWDWGWIFCQILPTVMLLIILFIRTQP